MSFGEYIDLDTYLGDWQLMNKAMSVLFRPITYKKKEQYLIEDYQSSDKYDLQNITLDIVFGSLVFFWNLRTELQNHILNYLANQKEVKVPQDFQDLIKNGVGINPFTDFAKVTLEK